VTESFNFKQTNKYLKLAVKLYLYMQITGRHTPRTPQSLQVTPDNYLILSSIGFNKANLSRYSTNGVNYMRCKIKIKK
jgi:hypothetical protein